MPPKPNNTHYHVLCISSAHYITTTYIITIVNLILHIVYTVYLSIYMNIYTYYCMPANFANFRNAQLGNFPKLQRLKAPGILKVHILTVRTQIIFRPNNQHPNNSSGNHLHANDSYTNGFRANNLFSNSLYINSSHLSYSGCVQNSSTINIVDKIV